MDCKRALEEAGGNVDQAIDAPQAAGSGQGREEDRPRRAAGSGRALHPRRRPHRRPRRGQLRDRLRGPHPRLPHARPRHRDAGRGDRARATSPRTRSPRRPGPSSSRSTATASKALEAVCLLDQPFIKDAEAHASAIWSKTTSPSSARTSSSAASPASRSAPICRPAPTKRPSSSVRNAGHACRLTAERERMSWRPRTAASCSS